MDYQRHLGLEPGAVARPRTVEEVAALVARANAEGRTIVPWGGGTGQSLGYPPRRADLLLDLSGLDRILAHEPGDLTVTTQAGVPLATVQKRLAAHGQFLPLDPPHADRATVGGLLAVNAWGPSRPLYGTARDWLIGLAVVDAAGRVIRGGGKVVKNVTGYDLPKLHVGALGTLGVIVEATFKVAPLPEASALLRYRLGPSADAAAFLRRLHAAPFPVLCLLHDGALPGAAAASYLLVGFEGLQEVVREGRAAAAESAEICGFAPATPVSAEARQALLGGEGRPSGSSRLRVRVSGEPSGSPERHAEVAAMGVWEWVRTLPGAGHTEAALRIGEDAGQAAARLLGWAEERGLQTTLLQAQPALRAEHAVWSPLPPGFPLMRRLKETLDPNGTLNPGRFVGKL